MAKNKQPNGKNKLQRDASEQLELAHQVLEKAKVNVEEAQNVIQDTKAALEQQSDGETSTRED